MEAKPGEGRNGTEEQKGEGGGGDNAARVQERGNGEEGLLTIEQPPKRPGFSTCSHHLVNIPQIHLDELPERKQRTDRRGNRLRNQQSLRGRCEPRFELDEDLGAVVVMHFANRLQLQTKAKVRFRISGIVS